MKRIFHIGQLTILVLLFSLSVSAQLSKLPVEKMTDEQLVTLLAQQQLLGLTPARFEIEASTRGLSQKQILIVRERMERMDPFMISKVMSQLKDKEIDPTSIRIPVRTQRPDKKEVVDSVLQIFGADLFDKEGISFEPNLAVPTPSNYVLGANDELLIDVFGLSEKTTKLRVSADGDIRYPNLGPIRVMGLTVEQATSKISASLAKIYPAIRVSQTKVAVSLSQIRTIRVTLVGELNRPGSYALPSLATIMHAIHAAGGPNQIGSYRSIQLIRGGKVLADFDLYSFLLRGDLSANLLLQDDDVIRVPSYKKRVAVKGAIKKPAIFDLTDSDSPASLLDYAGGLADIAFKEMIRVKRLGSTAREILTIPAQQLNQFRLISGDTLVIDSLANKYANRVQVGGAVYYPGEYGLETFTTARVLLEKAQIKESAVLDRGVIRRYQADLTPTLVQFNVNEVLSGRVGLTLQKDDSIHIYDQSLVKQYQYITIEGEVNQPGIYPFLKGMQIQDLILTAAGIKDGAVLKRVEVSRRIRQKDQLIDSLQYTVVKTIDLDSGYRVNSLADVVLEPFDVVYVRRSPLYRNQSNVVIEGEVKFPGKYALRSGNDRISDLLDRAGGLTQFAFPAGTILIRNIYTGNTPSDTVIRSLKYALLDANTTIDLSEAAAETKATEADSLGTRIISKQLNSQQKRVALDLNEALRKPGTAADILLEDGDIIKIPVEQQTIQSFGAINYPQQITYKPGMSLKNVINASGGFSANASKKDVYVLEANGRVRSTTHFLGMRFYPSLSRGAEVYVPLKARKNPLTKGEVVGITTGLLSLAGVMLAIINTLK